MVDESADLASNKISFVAELGFRDGLLYGVQSVAFTGCRSAGRTQQQRLRDSLGLWESLENPGKVAKPAPLDERLAGDAGSAVPIESGDGSEVSCNSRLQDS